MGITKARVTMKHSQLLPVFVLLSLHASSVFSLSYNCGLDPCKPGVHRKDSKECMVCERVISARCKSKEVVFGLCGCPECAKAKGEECSPFDRCAGHLTCYKENRRPLDYGSGVCVEKRRRNKKKLAGKLSY